MTIPLADILEPINVTHRHGTVTHIDRANQQFAVTNATEGAETTVPYDALILATGSELGPVPFDHQHVHNVDTIEAADFYDFTISSGWSRRVRQTCSHLPPSSAQSRSVHPGVTSVQIFESARGPRRAGDVPDERPAFTARA